MKKFLISLASILLIIAAVVLIRKCREKIDFGTGSGWMSRKPPAIRKVPPQDLQIRPGESKDDYWDRIVDTQGFPIVFYGRAVDQNGKPMKGVEVVPEVQNVLGRAKRIAGFPEFVKCPPVHTDTNGLFTISGYKGVTLSFVLTKDGYRNSGGGVHCQPGFSEPGFPNGYQPDPNHPVEYQMIRADMPPNECVFDKQFRIAWNSGSIILDLGEAVGRLVVDPSRVGKDPARINGFDWSVRLAPEGFVLAPLEGNQPILRMAPVDGYLPTFTAGAKGGDTPWLSGINQTFAIKTAHNRYGTMEVFMNSYGDELRTGFSVTIYLGQPGMRNIDRK